MRKEKASFLCLLSDDCELDHRRMDNVINEFVENAPIKGIKIKYGIYKNIDKNLSIATIYDYASMAHSADCYKCSDNSTHMPYLH